MVPYKPHQQPGLSQWTGGAMQASIVLDQPGNVSFTNLDQISGRVVVRCTKNTSIDSILVKLEGESRTRLLSPQGPNGEKPKPQLEYHKLLYRVQMAFPKVDVMEGRSWTSGESAYTLNPGSHEYPFNFKIPFNNACASEKGQMPVMSVSSSGFEVAKPSNRHVKKTLPPTLSGFPGEAEVRYYVKATVQRHGFWKENLRAFLPFTLVPIEPPRPPDSGNEVFARQKHNFSAFPEAEGTRSKMKSLFTSAKSKEPASPTSPIASNEAPHISVDARLPEPAILTCNHDIPLRLVVKKLNECPAMLYLQSLQVSLISTTKIRAHDVFRKETNSWIVMSKSNMNVPIGISSDPVNTEVVLDDSAWRGQPLPNTIAPSFVTCNIDRTYQLDVRMGVSFAGAAQAAKPQTAVLPLRLDAEVFSGIAPPPELLTAMAEARASVRRTSTTRTAEDIDEKLRTEEAKQSSAATSSIPPAQNGSSAQAAPPEYSDAPPSYEDAIASNLPPVDAPRPDYAPPPPGEDDVLRSDEKRGFMDRRNS